MWFGRGRDGRALEKLIQYGVMDTRNDSFSDGSEKDSSLASKKPFDQASSDDISKYSRYTADSRYVNKRSTDEDDLEDSQGDDPIDDADKRDFTPSHGLMSKDEADELFGSEKAVKRTAVGPRAQRLAAQRNTTTNGKSESNESTRRGNAPDEIDIPTASGMALAGGRASGSDVDGNTPASGIKLPRTSSDSRANLNADSPAPGANLNAATPPRVSQRTSGNPRERAQSNDRTTATYAQRTTAYPRNRARLTASQNTALPGGVTGEASQYTRPDAYLQKTHKTKRRRRRIVVAVVTCVLALVACGVGFAFAMVNNINSNLQQNVDQEVLDVLETKAAGEPFYMLLMGTDASTERRNSVEYAGDNFRTDSMMLLRIDPQNRKVACVSLMRDTKMDFGEYGIQKLNAAHEIGGTDFTIKTVSKLAGVPISHYAVLDFDGFKEVVDLLGGIEVDVQFEIDDDMAGGHLDAGLQTLNGDQALILSRSRHAYDDIGDGDAYRAANQRAVIAAIAKKVLASDVSTMIATIEKLSQSVETDFGVMDIVSLGNSMRGINMDEDFYTATMPTESEYSNNIWWEILDKPAWKKMMARIDEGLPPLEDDIIDPYTGIVIANSGTANTIDGEASSAGAGSVNSESIVHSGTVSVRNGCGVAGVAGEAAEILENMGFTTDAANANSSDFKLTVVVYNDDDQKAEAQQIADALGGGEVVRSDGQYIFNTDFLVVVGQDWVSDGAIQ